MKSVAVSAAVVPRRCALCANRCCAMASSSLARQRTNHGCISGTLQCAAHQVSLRRPVPPLRLRERWSLCGWSVNAAAP